MSQPEVIVSTYNNPVALDLSLQALFCQAAHDFSVCVADDGSGSATQAVIDEWRGRFGTSRLRHLWHPDRGFQKNLILNKAIQSSTAQYLIFIDGDCLACPTHVQRHLELRAPSRFVSGSIIRMPWAVNPLLSRQLIESREIFSYQWLKAHQCIDRIGTFLKTAILPAGVSNFLEIISPVQKVWNGCNSSGWRSDLLRVNGFDETMLYGSEDVEMGVRLNNASVEGRHIRYTAPLLHVEHSRGYADPVVAARNKVYMKSVRRSGKSWTENGIQKSQDRVPCPP